jgi:hypothetical protein
VGRTAGLDTEARGEILLPLPEIEPRSSGRPARSQTLYCLSYPANVIVVSMERLQLLFQVQMYLVYEKQKQFILHKCNTT